MPSRVIFRILLLVVIPVWLLGLISTPILGQTGSATQQATAPVSGTDDSDELPVYVNITGIVQALTQTSFTINGLTILVPSDVTLPSGVAVGRVVSLRGNLRDDDTITLIIIVVGYHLPTPTPIPSATSAPTMAATLSTTQEPTLEATEEATVPATMPAVADCNKPHQNLAVMISTAYHVAYNDATRLHCEGFSFGTIARAFLLEFTGKDEGKDISVDAILLLRRHGRHWSVIIILLGVQPDLTLIVLVLDGGRAAVILNCGSGVTFKHSVLCIGGSTGGSGGGGNSGGGDGKKKGKGNGDDQGEDD